MTYITYIIYSICIYTHTHKYRRKTKPTPLGSGIVGRELVFIYYVRDKLLICSNAFKLAFIALIISFYTFKGIRTNFILITSTVKISNTLSL